MFAAASLRDVVIEIGQEFERQTGTRMVFNFAGSNALARQIEAAPVADAFLSANPRWVDFIEQRGLVATGSRIEFASNRLVLIAHRDYPHRIDGLRFVVELPFKHLALANPDAVPAGIYARSELESREFGDGSLWDYVSDRIVPTMDVRAALGLVAADPEVIGIVYATDASSSEDVRILHRIRSRAAPVTYVGAAISERPLELEARAFLKFAQGEFATAVLARHGFIVWK